MGLVRADQHKNFLQKITTFFAAVPVLVATFILLVIAELFAIFVGPSVIPGKYYLKLYLDDRAEKNTQEFLTQTGRYFVRDDLLGWSNMPNFSQNNWRTDQYGSRATHDLAVEPSRPNRILFLGSSLINGSVYVTNDETISAYIEDSLIEAVNFGTMRYSIDQSYLAWRDRLADWDPNVIVVGICESDCAGIVNRYLPFRHHQDYNMPFLKPRFVLDGDSLKLLPVPEASQHRAMFTEGALLDNFSRTDEYYDRFVAFERFGITPLAYGFYKLYNKAAKIWEMRNPTSGHEKLLSAIMRKFVNEAGAHGATVVFLALPSFENTAPPGWHKYFPDRYRVMVDRLRSEGFMVLDIRETLQHSGLPARKLYESDLYHYSAKGNRLIADATRQAVVERHLLRTDMTRLAGNPDSL